MNVIAFLSQKGGSGKTTLSVHTAVAAEATGERVCVIDADPQERRPHGRARGKRNADRRHGAGRELDALRAAEGEGMTLAVGRRPSRPGAGQMLRRSELVLIPVRPSAFDSLPSLPPSRSWRPRRCAARSSCPPARSVRPRSGRRARRWPSDCRSFPARLPTGARSPAPSRPAAP